MDYSTFPLILCFALGFIGTWFLFSLIRSDNLPPGPRPFPIIGNIHQLSKNPHQSLASLSKTHGPLMSIRLGSIRTVIVSSPDIAKQVLQKNDHVFCSRAVPAVAEPHKISMFYLPFGAQYRKLRKICQQQMFSSHRLDSSQGLRREKLNKLLDHVHKCCVVGRAVDVGRATFIASLNMMSATLFSMDVSDFDSDEASKFKETFDGLMKVVSSPNLADFFPVLRAIDPQGILRQAKLHYRTIFDMFEGVIKERLKSCYVSL